MTEIEKVKAEIKVLESKIALLEALEEHKSPEEKAYFRAYGLYPVTDAKYDPRDIPRLDRWKAFRTGYRSATKDWKVMDAGYQPTPQEPEEVAEGLKTAFKEAVKQGVISRAGKICTDEPIAQHWYP